MKDLIDRNISAIGVYINLILALKHYKIINCMTDITNKGLDRESNIDFLI